MFGLRTFEKFFRIFSTFRSSAQEFANTERQVSSRPPTVSNSITSIDSSADKWMLRAIEKVQKVEKGLLQKIKADKNPRFDFLQGCNFFISNFSFCLRLGS